MDGKSETTDAPRRFYQLASAVPVDGGFAVRLDGRACRTPAGAPLIAPTDALAQLLAEEWNSQGERIRMASMPATRLAFTALDRVARAREAVCAEVARYASWDVLCYFADGPQALIERQLAAWGPVLEWAETELGLALNRAKGVVHQPQPAESLLKVEQLAGALDDFALAGLAHAAALFGSAVLAFALQRDQLSGEETFVLSRLDEAFQAERWGRDEEADARAQGLRNEAAMLERWFRALDA